MKILLAAAAFVALAVSGPASAQTTKKYFARSGLPQSSSSTSAPSYSGSWFTVQSTDSPCSCPVEGQRASCPVTCQVGGTNSAASNCNPATKPATTSNGPMCPYM